MFQERTEDKKKINERSIDWLKEKTFKSRLGRGKKKEGVMLRYWDWLIKEKAFKFGSGEMDKIIIEKLRKAMSAVGKHRYA